jgi:hypothetical protein
MQAMAKRIVTIILTFVVSTVCVGTASAETSPPPDWFERAAARGQNVSVIPNDRAGMLGVGGIALSQRPAPDWFERAALRATPGPANPDDRGGVRESSSGTVPQSQAFRIDDGFRWGDAALGAAAAVALLGLAIGTAATIRRRALVG